MKKYLITTCLLISFYLPSFSQNSMETALQLKRDNLKRIMPSLKGSAKVDCLNSIVDIYQILDEADQMQIDSATPYAKQAFNEAKRIGYKRGLGYAYLKMSYCEILMASTTDSKFGPGSLSVIENKVKQAMQIGEDIKDNAMTGSSYYLLSRLQRMMLMKEQRIDFLKKAITFFEKTEANQSSGIYKEMSFTDCNSCTGYELRLGLLYEELGLSQKDPVVVEEQMNKAINYYQKAGAKSWIGWTYKGLGNSLSLKTDAETATKYYKKAIPYFQEAQNENGEFDTYIALCTSYFNLGDFENGLEYSKRCVLMAEKLAKNSTLSNGVNYQLHQAYYWMGKFYSIANDYETAFAFMRKARSYSPYNGLLPLWVATMAEFHRLNGNYDSSIYYINNIGNRRNQVLITLSSLHISMHQYDSALILINGITKIVTENNNLVNLGRLYANAAKAYYGKNDYATALTNARTAFAFNKKTSRNLELIDNYQLLSDIYNKLGKNDSAYIYLKQYTVLKDSLINRQFYKRLNDYKKEAEDAKRIGQIKLLQKDNLIKEQDLLQQILLQQKSDAELTLLDKSNEIKDQELLIKDQSLKEQTLLKEQNQSQLILFDKENKLKDQQLKQQAFLRNALLGGLLLFILLGVFVFRNLSLKRKNEKLAIKKEQAELQQKVAELEMQALRAQMNPHFIFNCLSSINRFIFKNDNKVASDYLTRFSRLIRMVLMHSQKKLITLEDELEMLRLYLDLERLRFKDAFDYSITTTNIVDAGNVFIPPLLLQPFCENAVWHGLMHKESKGHLKIMISEVISEDDKLLHCIIEDDGVGREKAAEMKSKSAESGKSMGLKITTERLALLNRENNFSTFYKIEDKLNANNDVEGTRVQLKIRHKESIEELV